MTTLQQRQTGYTFDTLLNLEDSTTDAAADSGTNVVDLGAAAAGDNEDGVAPVRGDVVIDVSAIEIASNDELYVFTLVGSDSEAFTTGDQEVLQELRLGATEVLTSGDGDPNDVDSDTGRYILPFVNQRNTRVYRYVRLDLDIAGTIATGITWSAFIGLHRMA